MTSKSETTAALPATLREYRAATHGHLTATLTAAADEIERLNIELEAARRFGGGWFNPANEAQEAYRQMVKEALGYGK
jgi:hypothetical protein